MTAEKFEIKNRWTGAAMFALDVDASLPFGIKVGLAVKAGFASGADLSSADLRGADLSDARLVRADLNCADLSGADLSGADLSGANLSCANLSGADLHNVILSDADLMCTNLRGADLRNAGWVPKIANIHQAVYAAVSVPDALEMGTWHQGNFCGTTHCRAGWVCVLAGDAGRVMEGCMGTPAAAALIYMASDPKLERIPDFHASNATAMADMERLATLEAAVSV